MPAGEVKRLIAFSLALATSVVAAWLVLRGGVSHALTFAWVASIVLFAAVTRFRGLRKPLRAGSVAALVLAAALPVVVRVAADQYDRMHADEYLTAYFSATHDFESTSFFGYMPEKWEWQGQFPKPYFFLQRLFFSVFGESTAALRFSVQIYVAVVSIMLYLTVRELFDSRSALVAVVLYSFFAPSVYLETLGFFFISSTAAFAVLFYFGVREFRSGRMFDAAMAGIACGFCYVTYYSSYLALPMLLAFFAIQWLRERRLYVVQNFVIALGGILVVLAPFGAFLLRSGDYASRRVSDTSLLWGHLSPVREAIGRGELSPVTALRQNLQLTLDFFAKDGVGGGGGFEFARFSLLDRFSLALVIGGLVLALVQLRRRPELVFVLIALAGAVGMVVLTMPPPTVHRLSIAFPSLVILMTLPFALVFRIPKVTAAIRTAVAAGLLLVYVGANQRRYSEAVFRDPSGDEYRIAQLLNQRYGGRKLYVAAFPAFGLHKVFYFLDRSRDRPVETDFHHHLIKRVNPREKYVYVMTHGPHFRKDFERADPGGRYSRFSVGYSFFAN